MLFSVESFFRCGGDQFAIDIKRGCGIVPLGYAIFPFFQTGPMSLLKRNRVLKTADAQDVHLAIAASF
jgi:hypothetical protein